LYGNTNIIHGGIYTLCAGGCIIQVMYQCHVIHGKFKHFRDNTKLSVMEFWISWAESKWFKI